MENQQLGSIPAHEGTQRLSQETRQRLMNLHQREHGDEMAQEYLAQLVEAELRAMYVSLFDPCGVE